METTQFSVCGLAREARKNEEEGWQSQKEVVMAANDEARSLGFLILIASWGGPNQVDCPTFPFLLQGFKNTTQV
jgi:hypothetical protein